MPDPTTPAGAGGFTVRLARRGLALHVPDDRSVLDTLLEAGIEVPFSCRDGVCGTCETRVLDGTPEHWDSVLFGAAAEAGDRMMVCVSRSCTPTLTLDL